jgi:hypothetical protein
LIGHSLESKPIVNKITIAVECEHVNSSCRRGAIHEHDMKSYAFILLQISNKTRTGLVWFMVFNIIWSSEMGDKLSVVFYIPIGLPIDSLIIYFSRIKSL